MCAVQTQLITYDKWFPDNTEFAPGAGLRMADIDCSIMVTGLCRLYLSGRCRDTECQIKLSIDVYTSMTRSVLSDSNTVPRTCNWIHPVDHHVH